MITNNLLPLKTVDGPGNTNGTRSNERPPNTKETDFASVLEQSDSSEPMPLDPNEESAKETGSTEGVQQTVDPDEANVEDGLEEGHAQAWNSSTRGQLSDLWSDKSVSSVTQNSVANGPKESSTKPGSGTPETTVFGLQGTSETTSLIGDLSIQPDNSGRDRHSRDDLGRLLPNPHTVGTPDHKNSLEKSALALQFNSVGVSHKTDAHALSNKKMLHSSSSPVSARFADSTAPDASASFANLASVQDETTSSQYLLRKHQSVSPVSDSGTSVTISSGILAAKQGEQQGTPLSAGNETRSLGQQQYLAQPISVAQESTNDGALPNQLYALTATNVRSRVDATHRENIGAMQAESGSEVNVLMSAENHRFNSGHRRNAQTMNIAPKIDAQATLAPFVTPELVADGAQTPELDAALQISDERLSGTGLAGPSFQGPQNAQDLARVDFLRSLSAQVSEQMARRNAGSMDITHQSEELGRLKMAMQSNETSMTVTITAERLETSELVRRYSEQLIQDLRRMGFDQVELNFSERSSTSENPHRQDQNTKDDEQTRSIAPGDIDEPNRIARLNDQTGIDLRL